MKILVLNGPNLNMTGIRSKSVYGAETLEDINKEIEQYAEEKGVCVSFFQSNSEGAIIDEIHSSMNKYDGVVINAGAYTHYSYAIRDAIECVKEYTPFVEVDVYKRQPLLPSLKNLPFLRLNRRLPNLKFLLPNQLNYPKVLQITL